MKSFEWKHIVDSLGTLAIVGSLIFVGFEIKQSRDIAIADVYQQQAALLIDVQTSQMLPELFVEASRERIEGEELSDHEVRMLRLGHLPWLTYYENIHFQHEKGMISEELWESIKVDIRNRVNGESYFVEMWEMVRHSWRRSFAEEVDQIIREETGNQP